MVIEEPEKRTVPEASERFKIKTDTIYNAIQDQRLRAEWGLDGQLKVSDKAMEECFVEPSFPEFLSLTFVSSHNGLCINELKEDIKNGKLEAKKFHREWYVHNEEWTRYMKERFNHRKVIDRTQMAEGKFTVLNSRGIHKRPAYFFCGIAVNHPRNVITLTYESKAWEYEGPPSMGGLLEKCIQQGEEVEVLVSGKGSKELMDHILKEAARKFEVTD